MDRIKFFSIALILVNFQRNRQFSIVDTNNQSSFDLLSRESLSSMWNYLLFKVQTRRYFKNRSFLGKSMLVRHLCGSSLKFVANIDVAPTVGDNFRYRKNFSGWRYLWIIKNMMWFSWKHSRECRIIGDISRICFQIFSERAISRDFGNIRDWNIQRKHYPRIYPDKGCKMSDSKDFKDFFYIKHTALFVL